MKTQSRLPGWLLASMSLTALVITAGAEPSPFRAQPIGFRVDPGPGGQSARTPRQNRSQSPAQGFGQPSDAREGSAFLRVTLPKADLTVGELVPVEIKAYFRDGVSASLNGLPMLSSDAFALNKLGDHPEQTRETIEGVTYSVVTWSTALSGVKAGEYPLNLDLPVMLRVRERGKGRVGGRNPLRDFFGEDSPFGDSFFDDFFAQTVEKPLTLHSDGAAVKIKALPAKGRPSDFSGAVGQFDVASETSAAAATNGDPLTLKMTITGRGNFDRVSTAGLPASADWKTYRPGAHFAATDSSGIEGAKTFEQAIVPTKAGAQEIPALRFSYFDPSTEGYVTKTTAPIPIAVAQGAAAPASTKAAAPEPGAPQAGADGLAPDKVEPSRATSRLRPIFLAPWFIEINALMLAALIAGWILKRLRRRGEYDLKKLQHAAAEKAVAESLAAMDSAIKAQDARRFFTAARRALQDRLAWRWQLPASRVTIPEIRSRLNGSGDELRSVFQTADEIAYSGRSFTTPDLRKWRELVSQQLERFSRP